MSLTRQRIFFVALATCSVALVTFAVLPSPLVRAFSDDTGRVINWLGNYEQARQVARETGKPVFVMFR